MTINNETFGMTVEAYICRIGNFEISESLKARENPNQLSLELRENIDILLSDLQIVEYVGNLNNSVDFIVKKDGQKRTMSVKTNISGYKICPQKIGQTTKQQFSKYFDIKSTETVIKTYILKEVNNIIKHMFDNLFECDYMLYINRKDKLVKLFSLEEILFVYDFLNELDYECTRTDDWNESTTIKTFLDLNAMKQLTIAECQIHKHRNNVKFRFNMKTLLEIIKIIKISKYVIEELFEGLKWLKTSMYAITLLIENIKDLKWFLKKYMSEEPDINKKIKAFYSLSLEEKIIVLIEIMTVKNAKRIGLYDV